MLSAEWVAITEVGDVEKKLCGVLLVGDPEPAFSADRINGSLRWALPLAQ